MASEEKHVELPYVEEEITHTVRLYNPRFGNNRVCVCGHIYYKHFDFFEAPINQDVGCKYCACNNFVESTSVSSAN